MSFGLYSIGVGLACGAYQHTGLPYLLLYYYALEFRQESRATRQKSDF
jgi:hypothetical protein